MDPWKVVVIGFEAEDGTTLSPEELGRNISAAFNELEREGREILIPSYLGDRGILLSGYLPEPEEAEETENKVSCPMTASVQVQSQLSLALIEQTMSLVRAVNPEKEGRAVSDFLTVCFGQWSVPQMRAVLADLTTIQSSRPIDATLLRVLTYASNALEKRLRLHLQ